MLGYTYIACLVFILLTFNGPTDQNNAKWFTQLSMHLLTIIYVLYTPILLIINNNNNNNNF